MPGLFVIWFLLLAAAVSLVFGLLSASFRVRVRGILIAATCLGLIVGILYVTQWSQSSIAFY